MWQATIVALSCAITPCGLIAQTVSWRVSERPILVIGSADGELPYQLHRVGGALRLADGRIVVGNSGSGQLRFFDSAGRFLKEVARQGAGPGEFDSRSSLRPWLLGQNLLAIDDAGNARVNLFDTSGRFVNSFRLDPRPTAARAWVASIAGEVIVGMAPLSAQLQGPPGSMIRTEFEYAIYDTTGQRTRVLFRIPDRPRLVHHYQGITHYPFIPLTPAPIVAVAGRQVLLLRGEVPELERWSLDGALVSKGAWTAPSIPVAQIWNRYRETEIANMTSTRDRTLYGHFLEMPLPLPKFIPVANRMLVDPTGHVWIERFRLPWDSLVRWDILDSRGRLVASAATPPRMQVYQVGVDFILGRGRDSLDVEQVQMFRLSRQN